MTSRYAKTRDWKFQVVKADGKPAEGAKISIQLMNMAEHSQIAGLMTDADGMAQIQMGIGSFCLHVEKHDMWTEKLVTPEREAVGNENGHGGVILVQLGGEARSCDQDIIAPDDFPMHPLMITAKQKKRRAERVQECNQIRESRKRSTGQEIESFLTNTEDSLERQALVQNLSAKDHKDAKAWILERHLQVAKQYQDVWTDKGLEHIYQKYILSPRIWLEEMTDYRTFILEFYTENQKNEFQKAPETIWKWVQQNIQEHPELDDSEIVGTPDGVLRLMQGTGMSKRILFVAICRTFGIPARVNTVNLQAEYWKHGQFMVPGIDAEELPCLVTFSFPDSKDPVYGQSWSIGRLEGTDFVTLDLTDLSLSTVSIPAGTYRLITTNRLPNGNQYAKETIYVLQSGEEKNIPVCIRKLKLDDMRVSNQLDDFELKPKTARFSQIAGTHANILAFLVPGEEPTEHVLNEFLMQKEKWNAWITGSTDACLPNSVVPGDTHQNSIDQGNTGRGRAVHMVLQYPSDLENRTLQKVLQEIPGIQIWYGDFDELVEPLARRMYVDPDKLPLLIVTDPGMTAVYGCSGYHVGSVGLMLELLK